MAGRNIPLATGEYYHLYNRGVARQPAFWTRYDYEQAMLCLAYYRFTDPPFKLSRFKELPADKREELLAGLNEKGERLVDILSFVFMPNHFHLLVKQNEENGISTFLSRLTNSYTKYLNTKHRRVGPIFQGVFKAVHVESDEQLIHLSRYIHLNPLVSYVVKENQFLSYPWSSFHEYQQRVSTFVETATILSHFQTAKKYEEFVLDQSDYAKRLEEIKHLTIEDRS